MKTIRYLCVFAVCSFAASLTLAQEPAEEGFDYAKYRGVRKYIEGMQYELEPRLSGEMKNLSEINRAAHAAFKSLSHSAVAMKSQALPAWNVIGGHQLDNGGVFNSGRARDIAFGPGNIAYLATAGGGLWKTEDIAANNYNPLWVPLTDRLPTTSSGSVAVDPSNPQIVYLGTGEKSPDGYDPSTGLGLDGLGDGIYKSMDGGLNWTQILPVEVTGSRISEVLIDPSSPQTIYLACNKSRPSSGSDTSGGVLKSTDGGATWRASNLKAFGVLYMVMDPVDTKRLYVSGLGKIYRTSNGGDTWEQITSGLTGSLGRIAIDISPSSPNVLFASVGMPSSGTNGMYITTDYGSSWKKNRVVTTDIDNYLWIQPWFANAIAVHPTIAKLAIAGGLNVVRSQDSGKSWSVIGNAGGNMHADIHNIVYNGPSNLYICNDGGLSLSKNNGTAWINTVNNGIATLEFVGVDANRDFSFVLGGTQDNGTNRAYIDDALYTESNGGDGGRTWISQLDSNLCYTTQFETSFFRSLGAGRKGTWERFVVSSPCPFYPRYDADLTGEIVALGASSKIVVSVNGGVDLFAQKSIQSISSARAVRVFPSDPNLMWAGSGTGLWRSTDMGLNFTRTTISSAAGSITDIEIDPSNPQNLWISTQGYSASNPNVFKSADGGVTVTALPNFPPKLGCNAIVRQQSTGFLFVGTDQGVVYTPNEGQNWYALAEGMPNVPVNSMKIRGTNNDKLLAGTYGRGMFWIDISSLPGIDAVKRPANETINLLSAYPNPITDGKAMVAFNMKEPGVMTSTLLDVLGREVKILEKAAYPAGKNQFEFTTDGLASGTYIVLLTANGVTVSERIVVN